MIPDIKDILDVITNSSSECFSIKTDLNSSEVREKWLEFLESFPEENGTRQESRWSYIFDGFDVYEVDDRVYIDYPILCNVEDPYLKLCDLFGSDKVKDEGF